MAESYYLCLWDYSQVCSDNHQIAFLVDQDNFVLQDSLAVVPGSLAADRDNQFVGRDIQAVVPGSLVVGGLGSLAADRDNQLVGRDILTVVLDTRVVAVLDNWDSLIVVLDSQAVDLENRIAVQGNLQSQVPKSLYYQLDMAHNLSRHSKILETK